MIHNPYLDEFLRLPLDYRGDSAGDGGVGEYLVQHREPAYHATREAMVRRYNWAVPTEAAVGTIATHASEVTEIERATVTGPRPPPGGRTGALRAHRGA